MSDTPDKAKIQRLLDLSARIERFSVKIQMGVPPSPSDYDSLTDDQREFSDLLSHFGLRPPIAG